MKRPRVDRRSASTNFPHVCACGCGKRFSGGSSAKYAPACARARANTMKGTRVRDTGRRWLSEDDRAMLAEASGPDPDAPRITDENGKLVERTALARRYRIETDPRRWR